MLRLSLVPFALLRMHKQLLTPVHGLPHCVNAIVWFIRGFYIWNSKGWKVETCVV